MVHFIILTSSSNSLHQILFVSGLALIIGPQKTLSFFARKQKIRGSICFFGGIVLVFCKWPFFGMILETFGFLNLFGCAATSVVHLHATQYSSTAISSQWLLPFYDNYLSSALFSRYHTFEVYVNSHRSPSIPMTLTPTCRLSIGWLAHEHRQCNLPLEHSSPNRYIAHNDYRRFRKCFQLAIEPANL